MSLNIPYHFHNSTQCTFVHITSYCYIKHHKWKQSTFHFGSAILAHHFTTFRIYYLSYFHIKNCWNKTTIYTVIKLQTRTGTHTLTGIFPIFLHYKNTRTQNISNETRHLCIHKTVREHRSWNTHPSCDLLHKLKILLDYMYRKH